MPAWFITFPQGGDDAGGRYQTDRLRGEGAQRNPFPVSAKVPWQGTLAADCEK